MTSPLSLAPSPEPAALPLPPVPVDLLDPVDDAARHAGRSAVRRHLLAMHPVDDENLLLPGPLGRIGEPAGVFWALRAANDLHVALRTASFPTARAARDDALRLLSHVDQLDEVVVQSPDGTRFSRWYTLRRRVVLVSGQVWTSRRNSHTRTIRDVAVHLPRLD